MKKILPLLGVAMLLSSCFSINPQRLQAVEERLLADYPEVRIDSRLSFSLGALTLDMVDFLFVQEKSIDLSKVSRADIAVYEVSNMPALNEMEISAGLLDDLGCASWETVIRIRERGELFSLFSCMDGEKLEGLAFVQMEAAEIVVMNTRGNFAALLESLLESTLHEKGAYLAAR